MRAKERQVNYKKWFERSILGEEIQFIRNATQKGGIFGSKEFFDKVAILVGRDVILKPRGRPRKSL